MDVKDLYENIMGRRERVEIDREKENALTMAIESSIKVLKSCDLTGEDIDMFNERTYSNRKNICDNHWDGA